MSHFIKSGQPFWKQEGFLRNSLYDIMKNLPLRL